MKKQIDYQTQQFQVLSSASPQTYNIPLPINCILKGVSVEVVPSFSSSVMLQTELKLVEENINSNIRVSHQLAMGNICSYSQFSSNFDTSSAKTFHNKTLSYLYDHPIQKEGISLEINVYNATGSSQYIQIHWQVKNLEGGI